MALTGTFLADFNAFVAECMKADDGLNQMRLSAADAEKQIDKLTADFSGQKVVTEAAAMMEAVERIGGAAKLTETELQRVAAKAAEAATKLRAMGEDVPPLMEKWAASATRAGDSTERMAGQVNAAGGAAEKSGNGFNTMATGMRTADKTLGAFGISLGKEISALEEMGQVSGKSAGDLGKLGTAVAVAGAAVAGWNIGRWIANLTGADEKIASITARLMGWGDLHAQEAGAVADVLARASQNAGRAVTDMTEAIRINEAAVKATAEQYNTAAHRATAWDGELAKLGARLPQLRAEIDSGNSTTAEMARHFTISERAVDFLTRQMALEETALKKSEAAAKAHAEATADLTERRQGAARILGTMSEGTRAAIAADLEAGATQKALALAYGLSAVQIESVADAQKKQTVAAKEAAAGAAAAVKLMTEAQTTFYKEQVDQQATSLQAQKLAIASWQGEALSALAATGQATQAQYDEIGRLAKTRLAGVGIDWDALRDHSKAALLDTYTAAESTYQQALAQAGEMSAGSIEHFRTLRDEALAAYQGITTAAKTALDKQIEYAQAFGVTLQAAADALGISSEMATANTDRMKDKMQEATGAGQQLYVQMQQLESQARSTFDRLQAGMQLVEAYQRAGVATGPQTAFGGYNFQRQKETLLPTSGHSTTPDAFGQVWGTGAGATSTTNTLNVNVNNAEAGDIAARLMTEMRHSGVRF